MTDRGKGLIGEHGYLKGDPKDNHPERFPHSPEMDAISRLMFRRDDLEAQNEQLRAALKELFNMAKAYIPDPRRQDYNPLNESEEEWAIGMTYQKTEQVLADSGGE